MNLCATTAEAGGEKGPRLTDAELFEALDLSEPGLHRVRRAAGKRDFPAAKAALAAYLRGRRSVSWFFDPHRVDKGIRHNRKAADDTVEGRIKVISIRHLFRDGEIDWKYNPTKARKDLADNNEWQWQLGRMHFWRYLGDAYWATGEEKYAGAFVRQLESWVANCPRPDRIDNRAGSCWRTIECGIRMSGSWPTAYHRFLRSPSFTDDDVCLFVKCCVEHALYLREFHRSGNWLTMEMNGLYTVGGLFPELRAAAEWRTFAAGKLYEELGTQFLPDGAQIELTPGYHNVALRNIMAIFDKAKVFGRLAELPEDFLTRAEKAYEYNLLLMTPDRNLPRFNDSWKCNVPAILKQAVGYFPERRDFLWVATGGREGGPPAVTSHPFPYAGYFVMRSGWEREGNYLVLDAGPLGYGHVHQDKLNVVLWAYGREILFDGGGGPYERSRWRSYDIDTFSHNTVLLMDGKDGKPQRRGRRDRWANVSKQPIDARWESDPEHDFAAGVYDEGYGDEKTRPAKHTRRVLFLKPDVFVVADTLVPNDAKEHTYQARWHLLTSRSELDEPTSTVVTSDRGEPNLAVVPLLTHGLDVRSASGETDPELLGWCVQKSGRPEKATTVLHTRKGVGVQHFLTLLLPLRKDASHGVAQVERKGGVSAEVTFGDGRRLLIEATPNPAGELRARETLPGGRRGRGWRGEKRLRQKRSASPLPKRPVPDRRKPKEDAARAYDARLIKRLVEEHEAGRTPAFYLRMARAKAHVVSVGEGGGLKVTVREPPMSFEIEWPRLTMQDRRNLALAVLREGKPEDHCLAAFYLMATGDEQGAAEHLRRGGAAAAEVEAAFE